MKIVYFKIIYQIQLFKKINIQKEKLEMKKFESLLMKIIIVVSLKILQCQLKKEF